MSPRRRTRASPARSRSSFRFPAATSLAAPPAIFPRNRRPKAGCIATKARTWSPRSCATPRRRTANSMRALATFAALAALVTAARAAEPAKAYNHVRLIDGTGAPSRDDMAIVVKGERIVAITRAIAPGKNIVNMHGAIAMPGMINTHVHLATWPNLPYAEAIQRRNLYAGITAVRDMAGDTRELGFLARDARIGNFPSPDTYYA